MSRFAMKDQVDLFDSAATMIRLAKETLAESEMSVMLALEELDEVNEPVDPNHQRRHIITLLRIAQEAVTEAITAVSVTGICAALKGT